MGTGGGQGSHAGVPGQPPRRPGRSDALPVGEMIEELGHERFAVREKASRDLLERGREARSALVAARPTAPPEARQRIDELPKTIGDAASGERLRYLRALETLERIGG